MRMILVPGPIVWPESIGVRVVISCLLKVPAPEIAGTVGVFFSGLPFWQLRYGAVLPSDLKKLRLENHCVQPCRSTVIYRYCQLD